MLLPLAIVGLLASRFMPHAYRDLVWISSFAAFGASLVLWTPYLMIAGVCFFAMSQLPFPRSAALSAWGAHGLLLVGAAFCLWRTWSLWPDSASMKKLPDGAKPAPWWGYILGASLAAGLFGLMAYVFHFQDQ
jgi:hypothetical protein